MSVSSLRGRADNWQALSWAERWLIATRAPVLIMTVQAALLGGLLALLDGYLAPGLWFIATLGLTLAHATNNLINDYVDYRGGVDTSGYFRARYGTHVLLDGLLSEAGMRRMILATGLIALAIAIGITALRGWVTLLFIGAGAFFLLFYTAPLKRLGLGEPAVYLVWGPLMIVGVDFVIRGEVLLPSIAASLVLGLPPTLVIFGKHIDKLDEDAAKGINTLPVRLGESRSRLLLCALVVLLFAGQSVLIMTGALPLATLTTVLALGPGIRLFRTSYNEKPVAAPADYPDGIWPLWYVAHAFAFARWYSALMVIGLLAAWLLAR